MNKDIKENLKEARHIYRKANNLFDTLSDITMPLMKEVAIRNDPEEMLQYIGMTPCSFDRAEIRGQYKENFPWGVEEQNKCNDAQTEILDEIRNDSKGFHMTNDLLAGPCPNCGHRVEKTIQIEYSITSPSITVNLDRKSVV